LNVIAFAAEPQVRKDGCGNWRFRWVLERSKISASREASDIRLSSAVRKVASPSLCCDMRTSISACRSFSSRAVVSYSS